MSRANDFTLFIVILQAAIGFVDTTGMFSQHYVSVPTNNASYVITDLKSYQAVENQDIFDEMLLLAHWGIEALIIGIKIIFAVGIIFPTLIDAFHIPLELSLFIQAGVYYTYAVFYSQLKSGKGWRLYE